MIQLSVKTNSSFTLGVYINFSKAFDTVDRKILIPKLAESGVPAKNLLGLEAISNRKQLKRYSNLNKTYNGLICGIPQGSILGPLLFLI